MDKLYFLCLAISITLSFEKAKLSQIERIQTICSNPKQNNKTSIGIGNCQNALYYMQVGVGSPPQYFNLQIDTGSNYLWIPTINIQTKGFNHSLSSTYKNKSQKFNISYLSGQEVSTYLGIDYVSFKNTNINISSLTLFAYQLNITLPQNINGVIGMGYSSFNFLRNAAQNSQIKTSTFSLKLNRLPIQSILYYNQIPYFIQKQSIFTTINEQKLWQNQIISLEADNVDLSKYAASTAIIDSGTSYLYFNTQLKKQFTSKFLINQNCIISDVILCDCSIIQNLPTISFMLKNVQLYINAQDYVNILGPICQVNIFQVSQKNNQIILGDILFNKYIITFDKKNKQIGFYGNTTGINSFGQQNFIISQYIMFSILCLLLLFQFVLFMLIGNVQVKLKQDLNIDRRTQTQQQIQKNQKT